jgi:antimicrobial peptide system SdpB family protein
MSRLISQVNAVLDLPTRWRPTSLALALGRSFIAVATLLELLFTPGTTLFGNADAVSGSLHCAGAVSISIWCLSGAATHGYTIGTVSSIVGLGLAAMGYRPRWTCIPHWYLTFSFESAIQVPHGGDSAASIATLLLVPICLSDYRIWQWRPALTPSPAHLGMAMAAQLATRAQVAIIYITAAVSKLADFAWFHGYALYFVALEPENGLPLNTHGFAEPFVTTHWADAILSWLVIAIEVLIGTTILGCRRSRRLALILTILLHSSIAILMALPSFGIIMIGLVLIAYSGRLESESPVDLTAA